jgi:hypothetical protein
VLKERAFDRRDGSDVAVDAEMNELLLIIDLHLTDLAHPRPTGALPTSGPRPFSRQGRRASVQDVMTTSPSRKRQKARSPRRRGGAW